MPISWKLRPTITLALLAATTALGTSAHAQTAITCDVARHVGLGGGGVALRDIGASPQINPAALAEPVGFRTSISRAGLFGIGELAPDAWEILIRTKDFHRLEDLGVDVGRMRNSIGTENGASVRFGRWQVDLGGLGQLESDPNAPLRRWVRQGAAFFPPPGSRLTLNMGYVVIPSIAYGQRWSLGQDGQGGKLDAGLRLKAWVGRYRQTYLQATQDEDGFETETTEIADERSPGYGLDLGLRYSPRSKSAASYGLVILGLVEPSIGGMRQERTFNLGTAMRINERTTVVLDLLNATAANDRRRKAAAGVEHELIPRWLTLRGAVTTRGLAGGVGIGPFHFAYTKDGETTLGTQIRF